MDTTEFQNLPWFDNNDYLETFLDSIGYPPEGSGNRIIGSPQVKFWIHIKFWIYRDDNGIGGPDLFQIRRLMDDLNFRFNQNNNTMIGFYMKCDPTYINNSTHTEKTLAGALLLMANNRDLGSINVHVIENFNSGTTAGFSIPFIDAVMVPRGSYTLNTANGDLAHEIGHILGLAHTHQYSSWNYRCLTECVSRTRRWPTFNLCTARLRSGNVSEATGDGLRDTPADDNLVSNNQCFYNVTFGDDPWGDSYDNPTNVNDRADVRNIMSYNSATNCVDRFSRLQIAAMLWTIQHRQLNNKNGWSNPISTFDSFEPDNEAGMARTIQLNERQERSFHQQHNRNGLGSYTTQCDVDWVRFVPTCNATLNVFTSGLTARQDANTRVTLFNNTLTQLAQNDDIAAGNVFSDLSWNFVSGQEYFIRVENMSPGSTTYYQLQIGRFLINGDDNICGLSNNYFITNLPAGATVQWQVTGTGSATVNSPNATQTTLTGTATGTITLTATITSACGQQVIITKLISVGTPALTGTINPANSLQQLAQFNNITEPTTTYVYYNWPAVNNIAVTILGSNPPITITTFPGGFYFNLNGGLALRIAGTSPCGAAVYTDRYFSRSYGYRMTVSPNPAKNNMTVNLSPDENSITTAEEAPTAPRRILDSKGKTILSLFDLNTNLLVKQWKRDESKSKTYNLNINGLRKGIYVLQIDRENQTKTTKVIIE